MIPVGVLEQHSLSKDGTVILVGEPDAEDESSNSNVGNLMFINMMVRLHGIK